ncbi:MAG: type II toxin-antitoxin system PemK/MazF family toxin [Planctomycetes bacterium]|nr:type II toxin-antitoxin system PemK/MazF family toxin [Planctomycetota bacterium]
MSHGDVHWIDLPDRGGREQRGRRPAIVWQDTAAFPRLPTVLVIPFTSRLDALRFAATRRVEPTPMNGLTSPSVALVFQLGACDIRRLRERIGRLDSPDLEAIKSLALSLQGIAP